MNTRVSILQFVLSIHPTDLYEPEFIPALLQLRKTSRGMRDFIDLKLEIVSNFNWQRMWRNSLPKRLDIRSQSCDWNSAVAVFRLLKAITITVKWKSGIEQHFNIWRLVVAAIQGHLGVYNIIKVYIIEKIDKCYVVLHSNDHSVSQIIDEFYLCCDYRRRNEYTEIYLYDSISLHFDTLISNLNKLDYISKYSRGIQCFDVY